MVKLEPLLKRTAMLELQESATFGFDEGFRG